MKKSKKFIKYDMSIGSAKVVSLLFLGSCMKLYVDWDEDVEFCGTFPISRREELENLKGKYVTATGIALYIKDTDELLDFEIKDVELDEWGKCDYTKDWSEEEKEKHDEMIADLNKNNIIKTKGDRFRLIEEAKTHKIKYLKTTWYDKLWRNVYKWPTLEWKGKSTLHKIWDGSELEYNKEYCFRFCKPDIGIRRKPLEKLVREIEDKPDKRWKEGNTTVSAPLLEIYFGIFAFTISYEHDMFKDIKSKVTVI